MAVLTLQDIANVAAISAFVVPPVVSLLKQKTWSAGVKQAIAGAVSAIVAVAALIAAHAISGASFLNSATIVQTITLVYAASQLAYRGFHGSTPDAWLTSLGSQSENSGTVKKGISLGSGDPPTVPPSPI